MPKHRRLGLTLVEVVISAAIVLLLSIGIAGLFAQSVQTTIMVRQHSNASYGAQEAIERLVDTVRNSDGFTAVDTTSFTVNVRGASVRFTYDAGAKRILKDGAPYASQITAFTPTYLTMTGAMTNTPAQVSKLTLAITATDHGTAQTYPTSVVVRRKML